MESENDRIHIREILVRCIIGLNPEEREKRQDVVISIILESNLREAGRSDTIAATIDYKRIKNRVVQFTEESSFQLVETLAHEIAYICLQHPMVMQAVVTVDKPGALRFAKSVAVEVRRTRQDYPERNFDA